MRIAIPLAENILAEEFSRAGEFAIYDVHDQTRGVSYIGRQTFDQPGCGRTPAFLRGHSVEVVLGHRVSQKAENHLLEVGIVAIKDAPILSADALIAHLVSGTLMATAPDAAMHGGGCGGSGGCGHCGPHGEAQEHEHDHANEACGETHNHGCCGHEHTAQTPEGSAQDQGGSCCH